MASFWLSEEEDAAEAKDYANIARDNEVLAPAIMFYEGYAKR